MHKSVIAGVGIVAALGLTLTACSSSAGDKSPSSASATSAQPVTITYSNFISNGGNEGNLTTIVKAFEQANPTITVNVKTLPYADYFTALQTDIAAGTAADVFDIEYATYPTYQASGAFAPLKGVDSSAYRGDIAAAYQTDGIAYALPTSFSTVVLYYNKSLFDAAGLSYPTSSWTWKDEKAAADKLTNVGTGVWGDYQPISYYEFYKALVQAGGQFLNKDGKSVAFDSPAGIAAAKWIVGKSGTTMPTAEQGAGTPDFDTALWADGKLAMWHSGIWMFGAAAKSSFSWDIAVEPGSVAKASAVFSNAAVVSASSTHKEASQKFAEFLTSSQVMVDTRLSAGWELPAISDAKLLATYLDKGTPANRQAVFDSLDGIALPPVIGANQTQMQDIITAQLTEAASGRMSVEDALASAAKQINGLLG